MFAHVFPLYFARPPSAFARREIDIRAFKAVSGHPPWPPLRKGGKLFILYAVESAPLAGLRSHQCATARESCCWLRSCCWRRCFHRARRRATPTNLRARHQADSRQALHSLPQSSKKDDLDLSGGLALDSIEELLAGTKKAARSSCRSEPMIVSSCGG